MSNTKISMSGKTPSQLAFVFASGLPTDKAVSEWTTSNIHAQDPGKASVCGVHTTSSVKILLCISL